MKKIATFFQSLHADENGASFIEYTALLGVILATAIAVLTAVGTWTGGVWTALCTALNDNFEVAGVTCTEAAAG